MPAAPGTNEALSRSAGTRKPDVLGPSSTTPARAAAAARSRWKPTPSPPASAYPPEQTSTARAPPQAASVTAWADATAGTHSTTRSRRAPGGAGPPRPPARPPGRGRRGPPAGAGRQGAGDRLLGAAEVGFGIRGAHVRSPAARS